MTFKDLQQWYRMGILYYPYDVDEVLAEMRETLTRRLIKKTTDWEERRIGKQIYKDFMDLHEDRWKSLHETMDEWKWDIDRQKVKANLYHANIGTAREALLSSEEWLGENK